METTSSNNKWFEGCASDCGHQPHVLLEMIDKLTRSNKSVQKVFWSLPTMRGMCSAHQLVG